MKPVTADKLLKLPTEGILNLPSYFILITNTRMPAGSFHSSSMVAHHKNNFKDALLISQAASKHVIYCVRPSPCSRVSSMH
jgi:hypothetical protein